MSTTLNTAKYYVYIPIGAFSSKSKRFVKVGAFANKSNADTYLAEIKKKYSDAFIKKLRGGIYYG